MRVDEFDAVWRALSNPVRRRMLDLLRDGPRITGDIADAFPELSRFAVMQHLGVLEEARLILTHREGRRRLNYLNAVPLQQMYERWVSGYAAKAAKQTLDLKHFAERPQGGLTGMEMEAGRLVKIESEVRIAAPPEKVFAALTTELNDWWPHRFKPGGKVVMEPWVGGRCYEDWGDGKGALYGVCVWYEPPFKVASSAPSAMNKTFSSFNLDSVEPDGEGCIYRKSLTLHGAVPDEVEEMFRSGTRAIMEEALRGYAERGEKFEG